MSDLSEAMSKMRVYSCGKEHETYQLMGDWSDIQVTCPCGKPVVTYEEWEKMQADE